MPLLVILRDHLDEHLLRTGREGEELIFGRTPAEPFVPSSIDNRAQECWAAVDLEPITMTRGETYIRLASDRLRGERQGRAAVPRHSKIQTTFDVYGHLLDGAHDQVRERMDAYLLDTASEAGGEPGARLLETEPSEDAA